MMKDVTDTILNEVATVNTSQSNDISLPQNVASLLKVKDGDTLYMMEVNGDSVRLFTKNSIFYKQLVAAHQSMESDKEALKLLAK